MSENTLPIAKFRLGQVVSTPNALSRLTHEDILAGIQRHQAGDWGDMDAEDKKTNDRAVVEKMRILSAYHSANDTIFWIITEADRSVTNVDTLFHELVHSTGHEKRLKRLSIMERNGFGSDPYCREELIAELGSAYLCGQAGIMERTIDNSAAYIEGWLQQLKNDRTLIVYAAAQAQKAADFILGRTQESTVEA